MNRKEIQNETEYREWKVCPHWYCVKIVLDNNTGKVEATLMTDEKTKLPIVIQQVEKPQDGVFEDLKSNKTVYYQYHNAYKNASQQVDMLSV